ncbi:phage-related integrase [Fructilactobacillus fructivorans]|uniref:tyrosine-type recombinase/integrase n=1 Tax=Fructilactobacillus fructivorans TaxID=1614 RepID=UPI000704EAEC|nr:site-specific integrase [Fructilactobacillus fructivorans]KRN13424.1 phage-related integrase [Fructilactobacillus fructivorans]
MANIQKRNNKWRARVSFFDSRHKRRFLSKTFNTKTEAKKWSIDQEQKRNTNQIIVDNNKTLVDYYFDWYKTFKEPILSNATKRRYVATGNVLKRYWGNARLKDITFLDYQKFLNKMGSKGKFRTVQKVHRQTRASIVKAKQMHEIEDNFTDGATVSGQDGKDPNDKFLELEDMQKLLKQCFTFSGLDEINYAMIATSLLTGLRFEEVIGLTWDNIDWKNKELTVDKSYSQVDKEFQPTKNKTSMRTIAINDDLVNLLQKVKAAQLEFLGKSEKNNPNNFIFLSHTGNINSNAAVNKSLKTLSKHLGIKDITFHGLRHTHASYLLSMGISIQYVSKRLGHKNISITQQVYAHLLESKEDEEAKKTKKILGNISDVTKM